MKIDGCQKSSLAPDLNLQLGGDSDRSRIQHEKKANNQGVVENAGCANYLSFERVTCASGAI
jgi:hypothetical protein